MAKRDLPYGLFGWCFLVFIAAFMPWATTPTFFSFFAKADFIITGWNGNNSLLGVTIPNWVAVALAATLVTIGWFRAHGAEIDPKVDFRLALCGVLHAGYFVLSVLFGRGAQLGLGSILTLVAFVIIFRMVKKNRTITVESSTGFNPASEKTPPIVAPDQTQAGQI